MIEFRKAKFVMSGASLSTLPRDGRKEIALFGRSNVGKSTLINLLLGQGIAYSSKQAGKTKTLNYFLVDDDFYLVDAPGYGYTSYGSRLDSMFSELMEGYVDSGRMKAALLLFDARHEPSKEDLAMWDLLVEENMPYAIVLTKSDRAKQSEMAKMRNYLEKRGCSRFLFVPPKQGAGPARALVAELLKD